MLQMMGERLKMVHRDIVRSQEDLLEVTDTQMSENKSKCLWVHRAAKVQIDVWKIARQFILVHKNTFLLQGYVTLLAACCCIFLVPNLFFFLLSTLFIVSSAYNG